MSEEDESADGGDEEEAVAFGDRREIAIEAIESADGDVETLTEAIDAIDAALESAKTEADLDSVEELLDEMVKAIEAADLPESDDGEDEAPRDQLVSRVEDTRDDVEAARGPYADDVIETIETAIATITSTRWTDAGEEEVVTAVETFVSAAAQPLGSDLGDSVEPDGLTESLESVVEGIEDADLDPDDDRQTVAELVEAAEGFTTGLDSAEEWADLSTREQLDAKGFYDVLGHRKDYPPEWSALKEHEKRGNVDMVLLALEKLGMEFMEEHCLDALKRMGDEAALEPMLERAERRDRVAIEILGKIGSDDPVETIVEYIESDSDPLLQKTTLKALGEIGAESATGAIAAKLVADNEIIRSHAARSLGLIGDPRAIEPLADVLASDESATVRGSAAWALNQIGTERALEAIAAHAGDRTYLVQAEAERAMEAL